jgi:hypothetical protein
MPGICPVIALLLASVPTSLLALGQKRYIETTSLPGSFTILRAGNAAPICLDADDYSAVKRAATDLKSDIARVTGVFPVISNSSAELHTYAITIGTIGHSGLIDSLVRNGKTNIAAIAGKWESFQIQVVPNPLPGVESALVVAGSDKRGTIYGRRHFRTNRSVAPVLVGRCSCSSRK